VIPNHGDFYLGTSENIWRHSWLSWLWVRVSLTSGEQSPGVLLKLPTVHRTAPTTNSRLAQDVSLLRSSEPETDLLTSRMPLDTWGREAVSTYRTFCEDWEPGGPPSLQVMRVSGWGTRSTRLQHLPPNSFMKLLGKAQSDCWPLYRAVSRGSGYAYSPVLTPKTLMWQVFSPDTSAKCFNASVGGPGLSNLFFTAQKVYTTWEKQVSWEWQKNRKIYWGWDWLGIIAMFGSMIMTLPHISLYLTVWREISVTFVVAKSCPTLWPHGLQHTRLPCPSLLLESGQIHEHISNHLIFCAPFSFCLQSFPAWGSFPTSQLFVSGGQSIGASASSSVLPMNIQGWFPSGLTGVISLQSKELLRVFSSTIQKHQFFSAQSSQIYTWLLEKP